MPIILASNSVHRARILTNAGIEFVQMASRIDEREVEASLPGLSHSDMAVELAKTKACNVSQTYPDRIIIGADQTLSFDGKLLHKPKSLDKARFRLELLSGETHFLHSAVVFACHKKIIWNHCESVAVTFRTLSMECIENYLNSVGDVALTTAGGYQIEGLGGNLIDKIEGDHFSAMGYPCLLF